MDSITLSVAIRKAGSADVYEETSAEAQLPQRPECCFFYTIFSLPLKIGMNKPQCHGKPGKAKNEEQYLYCSTFMRKHCVHLILKWVDQKSPRLKFLVTIQTFPG
jgi:hypothetical protein